MKVYTKNYYSDFGEQLIGYIILFGIPIGFSIAIVLMLKKNPNILEFISNGGLILSLFDLFFIVLDIIILYSIITDLIPKKCKAKLIDKKEEMYLNQTITNMLFACNLKRTIDYECYSIGQNSLKINEEYNVTIKNNKIYSIDNIYIDTKEN